MKLTHRIILAAICVTMISAGPATQPAELFDLEVKLNDIYNADFTVETLIRFDQPFVVRATNGKVTNIFWGELHPPADGKYGLDLSTYEGESPASNISGGGQYVLKLGESATGGVVMSFAYMRTVTLRRHEAGR